MCELLKVIYAYKYTEHVAYHHRLIKQNKFRRNPTLDYNHQHQLVRHQSKVNALFIFLAKNRELYVRVCT